MSQEMMLVTCILYGKGGPDILEALHQKGLNCAYMHHARGEILGSVTDYDGKLQEWENEIITVLAPEGDADAVFTLIYEITQKTRVQDAFLFMNRIRNHREITLAEGPHRLSA